MDKIIKKDIVNGVEYKYNGIGGGGSITDNNVIYISQADYDNLTPAEKADATKNYVIIGQGGIPVPTEIDAEDVNFDNTGTSMQSDNVQDAIEEVFQSVSNGKELIADAITDKGVSTSASDSFQTMASNISSLNVTDMTQDQTTRYNSASGLVYYNGGTSPYRNGCYMISGQGIQIAYLINGTNAITGVMLRGSVVKQFSAGPDMRGNFAAPSMYKSGTSIYIQTSTNLGGILIDENNNITASYNPSGSEAVSAAVISVGSNEQKGLGNLTTTCYKSSTSYYYMIVTGTK